MPKFGYIVKDFEKIQIFKYSCYQNFVPCSQIEQRAKAYK
jgi:hypothetical protein